MSDRALDGNPNLATTRRVAEMLGATVVELRATGELMFSHVTWPLRVRVNGRRKDTPRKLLVMVRKLAGERGAHFVR